MLATYRRESAITVADVGEFGLIARILARLPQRPPVLLGPGDDAAVLAAPDGRVVATTDLLVEGRHFRIDWMAAYDVGRRAAAASLADVAAMGAVPTGLLVGFGCPPSLAIAWVDGLADGLRDEAARTGASVVGGDVVRSDAITVAVTALGDLHGREPVTRRGAGPGDSVVVAGRLGRAAAGLALLERGHRDGGLVDAFRRPDPPYAVGPLVAAAGATSMIDVSDGLLADLGHVAAASGVRVEIDAAALPRDGELVRAARDLGADVLDWLSTGGEDHALAATLPAGVPPPPGCRRIGRVLAGEGIAVRGAQLPPGRSGFDHFRGH